MKKNITFIRFELHNNDKIEVNGRKEKCSKMKLIEKSQATKKLKAFFNI